jgi:membrane-associated protease RseP (regulator of RpoE activity)
MPAAAAAGIQPGDRIVGFGGQSVASFDDFTSVVRAHAGTTVDLTVERDGQTIVVPATIGWSLNADGARALAPLAAGDRVTAVGDTPISSYSDLVAATQRVIGPMVITFDRSGRSFTTTLDGPVAMPIDGAKGFLGVGPASVLVRAGIVQATGQAATGFADVVVGSVQGIGRVFSPSGLGRLASQVANGGSSETDAKSASTSSIQPIDGGSTSVTSSSGSSSNLDRPLSAIGIVSVIQQLGESGGWEPVLLILATVSIFLGLINLVPLLPFDGGHIAVATYEEVRGRLARKSYRANINKLIPVTYVVLFVMVCLFLSTSFLDTVAPPKINP